MDASSEQCAKTADSGTPRTDAMCSAVDKVYGYPSVPHAAIALCRILERELIQAQYELDMATNAGVIECAIRNKAVAEYMNHWETRAVNAERKLSDLPQP